MSRICFRPDGGIQRESSRVFCETSGKCHKHASLTFPVVKLLDYEGREEELETSDNPFALLVLAYIKALATKKEPESRFHWKFHVYKLLYERGHTKEDILELTRFIDWMMALPEALEHQFEDAISQYEEEQKMQYVTSHECIGLQSTKLSNFLCSDNYTGQPSRLTRSRTLSRR